MVVIRFSLIIIRQVTGYMRIMKYMIGIYQFLRGHGCFHNKTIPRTHTIMSGGVLYVPEENYDEFLGIYAQEIDSGNRRLAFSELKSGDVFRMYFDIDILETYELDLSYFILLCQDILQVVREHYPGVHEDTFKCVLCTTKPKKRTQDDFIKNGCHLIFPSLHVNLDTALQIRFFVVQALENRRGVRDISINPWCDIIDKAPYYNGLKMCGSVKTIPCAECKGVHRNVTSRPEVIEIVRNIRNLRRKFYPRKDNLAFDYSNVFNIEKDEFKNEALADLFSQYQEETGFLLCMACGNRGWYLEQDRFYMPAMVLSGDGSPSEGELEYLVDNLHEAMRWTSIRCRPSDVVTGGYTLSQKSQEQYLRYDRCDHFGLTVRSNAVMCLDKLGGAANALKLSPAIYREAVNGHIMGRDAEVIRTWKGDEITDRSVLDTIQREVRTIHKNYGQVVVRQAFHMVVAKSMTVDVINTSKKRRKVSANIVTSIAIANRVNTDEKQSITKNNIRVVARVSGPGASFCMNKNDEHGSNTIYFWLGPEGIAQKCFSRKEAENENKSCKNYRSTFYPISSALKTKLFPPDSNDSELDKSMENRLLAKKVDALNKTVSGLTTGLVV